VPAAGTLHDTVFRSSGVSGDVPAWIAELAWIDQVQRPKPKTDSSDPAATARAAVDRILMSYAL
jgi:hypothetical protein